MSATSAAGRVLLVDAQRAFAQALAFVIDRSDRLTCVGQPATVEGLAATVHDRRPDVVLLDVDLLGADARWVRAPLRSVPLVVLGTRLDAGLFARAAEAGACSVVGRDQDLVVLLRALEGPFDGGLHPEAAAMAASGGGESSVRLTPRELEVLGLLAQGLVPRAVAARLGIGLHTTRGHVKSVLAKLDAHSALEAVARARERGLV